MKYCTKLCVWVVTLVLAMANIGRAAPLDDRIPGSSVFYVGWTGADALAPQYAGSNLKGFVDATTIGKFVQEWMPRLVEMAARNDPNAPQMIAKLQTGLGIAWRHPVAIYFCPIDFTNFQQPIFRFGILCDAGDDSKTLVGLLNEALQGAPQGDPNGPRVSQEGNVVLLTIGKPDKIADLKAGGTLSASPAYMKAMAQVKLTGATAVGMYVNLQGVLAMVDDAMTKGAAAMPPDAPAMVRKVIDALGVRGLTQVAMQAGFDNKGWGEKAFVGTTGPRTGVLTLVDATPLSDNVLAVVPKDAAAFSASKFDLGKIYTEARSVVGKIDNGALQEMDRALDQAKGFLGFDINTDFIQTLGDEWVFYRAPGDAGMSWAIVTKLRNPDLFAKTLDKMTALYNERSGLPIKVEKVRAGTADVSMVSVGVMTVAWGVHNGSLFVSSLAGIPAAMAQVDDKSPSIAESDLYKSVMKTLPQGIKPTSIAYANPAKLYPDLRNLLLSVIPLARSAGVDIPMDLLPDPTQVAKFMPPGGTVGWTDADGLHAVGTSAFPGAELVSGQGGATSVVAVTSLGAAILLPSLGKARELSNRTTDAANLRGIAMSCMLWSNDHKDAMPDHLARLILDVGMSPKLLVSKRIGTAPLEMTPELEALGKSDFDKFAALVDAHCDYVYLGKGTKSQIDASVIVAYGKTLPMIQDGINIAYQDTHVDFVRWGSIEAEFAQTIDFFAKNHLPAINLDAIKQFDARSPNAVHKAPAGLP